MRRRVYSVVAGPVNGLFARVLQVSRMILTIIGAILQTYAARIRSHRRDARLHADGASAKQDRSPVRPYRADSANGIPAHAACGGRQDSAAAFSNRRLQRNTRPRPRPGPDSLRHRGAFLV